MASFYSPPFMITLAVALALLTVLSSIIWFLLKRYAGHFLYAKRIFLVALFIHLAMTLFVYYADFYPFGGGEGDQPLYDQYAKIISQDFRDGIFSISRLSEQLKPAGMHGYHVLVAVFYALTIPEKLVGMMVSVWFSVISVLLVYLIAYEISSSQKGALWAGIVAMLYPSHIYYGGFLLKDVVVVPLVLLALWSMVKISKSFSWKYWILFAFLLFPLLKLRFYIGLAVLSAFLVSWPFLLSLNLKRKILYGMIALVPLGFIPMVFGHGYYGITTIQEYVKPNKIEMYRDYAYIYEPYPGPKPTKTPIPTPALTQTPTPGPTKTPIPTSAPVSPIPTPQPEEYSSASIKNATSRSSGFWGFLAENKKKEGKAPGSTVVISSGVSSPLSFVKNYLISYSYVSMGPFPWHLKYLRHYFVLLETIPWLVVLGFIVYGVIRRRREWQKMVPVAVISLGMLTMLALIVASNFGIYMRLRMPAFLALSTLVAFAFPISNVAGIKIYENIRHWWSRIYRITSR